MNSSEKVEAEGKNNSHISYDMIDYDFGSKSATMILSNSWLIFGVVEVECEQ